MVTRSNGPARRKIIAATTVTLLVCAMVAVIVLKWCWPEVFYVGEDSWKHYQHGGIFSNASPSLLREGRDLVYASPCTGNGDIYLLNLATGIVRRLTNDSAYESSPVVAPDGKTIAFVREKDGCRHIWLMDDDGREQTQLTNGEVLDDVEEFSADGQYVIFSRSIPGIGRGRRTEMYIANTERTGAIQTIGQDASLVPGIPAVVYIRLEDEEIQYRRLEDGMPSKPLGCRGRLPRVSPDGRHLLIVRSRNTKWSLDQEIWVRNIETGKESLIGSGHAAMFLSNGEAIVYYIGYECKIVVVTIDNMKRIHVDAPVGYKTVPRYDSRTGDMIFGFYRGERFINEFYRLHAHKFTVSRIATVSCE
jgi:hypothetical protein